jgi:predicted nucleotide-binding protein
MLPGASLPEKFETLAENAEFAIALLTPDDLGKEKSEEKYNPRTRQNVLVEIWWFWGRFGREHVLLIVKEQVKIPSDLQGIEYFKFKEGVEEVFENICEFYRQHGILISQSA